MPGTGTGPGVLRAGLRRGRGRTDGRAHLAWHRLVAPAAQPLPSPLLNPPVGKLRPPPPAAAATGAGQLPFSANDLRRRPTGSALRPVSGSRSGRPRPVAPADWLGPVSAAPRPGVMQGRELPGAGLRQGRLGLRQAGSELAAARPPTPLRVRAPREPRRAGPRRAPPPGPAGARGRALLPRAARTPRGQGRALTWAASVPVAAGAPPGSTHSGEAVGGPFRVLRRCFTL